MRSTTTLQNPALASDTATARSPKRPWVRVVVAVVATGFAVSAVFGTVFAITEIRRSMVAEDIEDSLGAVPGVTAAEASYSYKPFSTGRMFTVDLQVSGDVDSAELSDALVASQERWHDSPLADDAVSTGVMLTAADAVDPSAEGSTLSFADWALPAEETGQQVAYWSMLRDVLSPAVTMFVATDGGKTSSSIFAELSSPTVPTAINLAERIEQSASVEPPAGRWSWSISVMSAQGADTSELMIDTRQGRPDAEMLALWRDAATLASSSVTPPGLWLRTDKSVDPHTWLHVSFPTVASTEVIDPAADSFANGPHWGEATAYADLVAARQGTRLSLQAGSTFVGSISRATCDGGGSTPAESATNDALLEHLRTTGADFC